MLSPLGRGRWACLPARQGGSGDCFTSFAMTGVDSGSRRGWAGKSGMQVGGVETYSLNC